MFRKRYDDLINAFEGIVFEHIDTRVLEYLKKKSREAGSPSINLSHQELASELGTTRVVISRILKDYEKQNKVKLHRGRIDIL